MTADEAHNAVVALVEHHINECANKFSPAVANYMIACLAAMTDALREQCAERKDSRDVIITLTRMFVEADNAATLLANARADTILSKGKR